MLSVCLIERQSLMSLPKLAHRPVVDGYIHRPLSGSLSHLLVLLESGHARGGEMAQLVKVLGR